MNRIKVFTIMLLITMLVALPVGKAMAASGSDPINGTIVNIKFVTDGDGTSVLVDLLDSNGQAHTVKISLETAIILELVKTNLEVIGTEVILTEMGTEDETTTGLVFEFYLDSYQAPTLVAVTLDPLVDVVIGFDIAQNFEPPFVEVEFGTGYMTAVDPDVFETVTLGETTGMVYSITVDDPNDTESNVTVRLLVEPRVLVNITLNDAVTNGFLMVDTSKIGQEIEITDIIELATFGKAISKLGSFFAAANLVGVDFTTLQEFKDDGYGYGVIAQALWMAANIGGDEATFKMIMEARRNGDFSKLSETATNWGQFRNEVLTSGKQNMGQIISGKAELETTSTENESTTTKTNNGNGNSTDKTNNGKANSESHGNSNKNKP